MSTFLVVHLDRHAGLVQAKLDALREALVGGKLDRKAAMAAICSLNGDEVCAAVDSAARMFTTEGFYDREDFEGLARFITLEKNLARCVFQIVRASHLANAVSLIIPLLVIPASDDPAVCVERAKLKRRMLALGGTPAPGEMERTAEEWVALRRSVPFIAGAWARESRDNRRTMVRSEVFDAQTLAEASGHDPDGLFRAFAFFSVTGTITGPLGPFTLLSEAMAAADAELLAAGIPLIGGPHDSAVHMEKKL